MFWVIVLLLFLGIILIILEAVVPHGLSVIAGLAVIGASVWLCFREFGIQSGVLYLVMSIFLAAAAAYVALRSGVRYMALSPAEPARGARKDAPEEPEVGDLVEVIQPLRPTGTVEWRGRRFPARTLRPELELPIGAQVRLKAFDSVYLLVEPGE